MTNYNAINIAKLELASLKTFQHELYLPEVIDEDDKENLNTEEFSSFFTPGITPITWSTRLPIKFKCYKEDNNYIYTPDIKFHYMLNSTLYVKIPKVRVLKKYKEQVKICWTHNLGLNIINNASLCFDDEQIQSVDRIWINIASQDSIKYDQKEEFNRMIGNIPQLEEWNTTLKPYLLKIPQFWWYYSKNEALAVPLFLLPNTKIYHRYNYKLNIAELIRMQFYNIEKKEWIDGPCNIKYIKIGYNKEDNILEQPELWGTFSCAHEGEIKWWFDPENIKNEYSTLIQDVIMYDDNTKLYSYGDTFVHDLPCEYPCRTINWVAENSKAVSNNYYSNFTTNFRDLYEGYNPLRLIKLTYGGEDRIPDMPKGYFDEVEHWYCSKMNPTEPGYNKLSFGYKSTLFNDIAIVLKSNNAKISILVKNMDPFKDEEDNILNKGNNKIKLIDSDESDDEEVVVYDNTTQYKIHVRLLVSKVLKIKDKKYTVIPSITPVINN